MIPETKEQLAEEIRRLKAEKNVLILAHLYENLDVQRVADFCGDSFELAKRAKASDADSLLFCGVRFMGESAKILNPEKNVYLPVPDAGCAMADTVAPEDVRALRALHPNAAVVCYINSSAETKAACDVCVTSSNALRIVRSLEQDEIIFVPDKNLGSFIAAKVPEKTFYLHNGCCPVHEHLTAASVERARAAHPNALLLVHPECEAEVVEKADFVGSTSEILRFAAASESLEFIIGTERAVCERLSEEQPDKAFYLLADTLVCKDMKKTTLADVYRVLRDLSEENAVRLDPQTATLAAVSLERMMNAAQETNK